MSNRGCVPDNTSQPLPGARVLWRMTHLTDDGRSEFCPTSWGKTWRRQITKQQKNRSGRRDSNPRRRPWQNHKTACRAVTSRAKQLQERLAPPACRASGSQCAMQSVNLRWQCLGSPLPRPVDKPDLVQDLRPRWYRPNTSIHRFPTHVTASPSPSSPPPRVQPPPPPGGLKYLQGERMTFQGERKTYRGIEKSRGGSAPDRGASPKPP